MSAVPFDPALGCEAHADLAEPLCPACRARQPDAGPVRVHYYRLNPSCAYCGRPAVAIRVTTGVLGIPPVATMCAEHQAGEAAHFARGAGHSAPDGGS